MEKDHQSDRMSLFPASRPDQMAAMKPQPRVLTLLRHRPPHLPRLFDAFFTTKPKGIGLGLAMALESYFASWGWRSEKAGVDGNGTLERCLGIPAYDVTLRVDAGAEVKSTEPIRIGRGDFSLIVHR
jgi:hypothetical protein